MWICTGKFRFLQSLWLSSFRSTRFSTALKSNESTRSVVIFSGIQPTGILHLGNYLGAVKNWVCLQDRGQVLYSIVDLHSITLTHDPKKLRQNIRDMAACLIACGVDPQKSILYQQSEVSQHCELAWILSCLTPTGFLNRMHQWKTKTDDNKETMKLGLYAYPTLMAADILLYRSTHVPVGEDQQQHVELAAKLSQTFNKKFGYFFNNPEVILGEVKRVKNLKDPTSKMSKSSLSAQSRIDITDSDKTLRKKIQKALTDSEPFISYDPDGRPGVANLVNIYSSLSGETVEDVCKRYEGKEWFTAELKKDLADVVIEKLGPIREEVIRLQSDASYVDQVLQNGAERARTIAQKNIQSVHKMVGFK